MPEGKPQKTGKQEPAPFEFDLPSMLQRAPESKSVVQTIPWQPKKLPDNNSPATPSPVRTTSESKILNRFRTGPAQPVETESPPPRSRIQTLGLIGLAIVVVLGLIVVLKDGGTNEVAARAENLPTPSKTVSPETPATTPPLENVRSTDGRFQIAVFPSSGVQLMVDGKAPHPVPQFIDLAPGSHRLYFTAQGYSPELLTPDVTPGERGNLTVFLKTLAAKQTTTEPVRTPAKSSPAPAAAAAKKAGPAGTAPDAPVVATPGTLAVSAPVPVEIFEGTQDLGTTPATLELSPGTHTLEYRFGNLKKTLTHTIRSGESITSTVSFDVVLQINARPWAQVFIDGIQPRTLGQTPLSDIKVSAGTVLIFRHPSFPEKKVRVTGETTTIQVVFP